MRASSEDKFASRNKLCRGLRLQTKHERLHPRLELSTGLGVAKLSTSEAAGAMMTDAKRAKRCADSKDPTARGRLPKQRAAKQAALRPAGILRTGYAGYRCSSPCARCPGLPCTPGSGSSRAHSGPNATAGTFPRLSPGVQFELSATTPPCLVMS